MLQAALLVLALSMDAFVASIAYGTQGIHIPWRSKLVIALTGATALGLSLFLGDLIQRICPHAVYTGVGFAILFLMGFINLFQNTLKRYLKKHQRGKITFGFADISFILDIYLDETKADMDNSKLLNIKEAFVLAAALSLDSLFAGLGMGFTTNQTVFALLCCLALHLCAVTLGCAIGRTLSGSFLSKLWWLSGAILILLAVMKLV